MTEKEAKTKWCPFARVVTDGAPLGVPAINRGTLSDGSLRTFSPCIGSACMAWRSMESAEFKAKAEAEFRKSGIRLASTEGFCGLAGKP